MNEFISAVEYLRLPTTGSGYFAPMYVFSNFHIAESVRPYSAFKRNTHIKSIKLIILSKTHDDLERSYYNIFTYNIELTKVSLD